MNLPLYQQLRQGAAASVPLRRALWRLAGPDRVRYLNGQVTNDVSRLAIGKVLYAAVTSTKGRMVGDIFIGAAPDALYVDAALELRETLAPRLEKYLIADDAAWEDLTDDWTLTHVFGTEQPVLAEADSAVAVPQVSAPEPAASAPSASRDSVVATINDVEPAPPSSGVVPPDTETAPGVVDIAGEDDGNLDLDDDTDSGGPTAANVPHVLANTRFGLRGWDVWQPSATASFPACTQVPTEVIDTLCVEHGLAQWGVDMTEANLPPESLLEQRSISYTKGCYVGQEIIARLKSVGQVNKRLCVLRLVQAAGGGVQSHDLLETILSQLRTHPLSVGEREVGRITSAVWSPEAGRVLCLGYVNRSVGPEVTLSSGAGYELTIISPPLTIAKI